MGVRSKRARPDFMAVFHPLGAVFDYSQDYDRSLQFNLADCNLVPKSIHGKVSSVISSFDIMPLIEIA